MWKESQLRKILNSHIHLKNIYISSKSFLYQELSVKDNLLYFKSFFKTSSSIYLALIDEFKLNKILHEKVKNLSDGKKIVNIVKSLLNEYGKVYLLDEPLTNLDEENIEKVKNYLSKNKKNNIIIIATHNYDKFGNFFDKVLNLEEKCHLIR